MQKIFIFDKNYTMKKIQVISLFVLLFSTFTFTSCDDEVIDTAIDLNGNNNNGGNNNGNGAYFRADFSGATWTAQNTAVVISGNSFSLVATRGTANEGFEFDLNGSSVGSYAANVNHVAFTPATSTFGYWGINPTNANENTGSVTITSINTTTQTVSGIFSYKGYWSDSTVTNILPIIFTNGVFNNLPYVTVTPSTDSFFANVDGVNFVDNNIFVTNVSNVIQIKATNTAGQNIIVGIRDNVTPGAYPITGNIGTDVVQASYKFGTVALQAHSGTVTVTSKTATRIVGTFSFTSSNGSNNYQITQGQFDVDY